MLAHDLSMQVSKYVICSLHLINVSNEPRVNDLFKSLGGLVFLTASPTSHASPIFRMQNIATSSKGLCASWATTGRQAGYADGTSNVPKA